jgi:hypothetical protein
VAEEKRCDDDYDFSKSSFLLKGRAKFLRLSVSPIWRSFVSRFFPLSLLWPALVVEDLVQHREKKGKKNRFTCASPHKGGRIDLCKDR